MKTPSSPGRIEDLSRGDIVLFGNEKTYVAVVTESIQTTTRIGSGEVVGAKCACVIWFENKRYNSWISNMDKFSYVGNISEAGLELPCTTTLERPESLG